MAAFLKARDINECPVCMDEYVKPQKLECDHSLCNNCLESLDYNGNVKCPLCNQKTARNGDI